MPPPHPRISLDNNPSQPNRWEIEFQNHRVKALMRHRRQEKHLTRTVWQPSDGEGPEIRNRGLNLWTSAQWKTIHMLWDPIKENRWPPRNVQLSDCWVYLTVKLLPREERALRYPADFDKEGNIRPSRVPCGNPPVVYAHGLYCLPVYKLSYVLCGEKLAAYGNWILGSQRSRRGPAFTLGLVCIPAEVIPSKGPNIERYLFFHDQPNPWDLERPATEDWKAAEAHGGTHDGWCLRDSDYGTLLYGMHGVAEPNYTIVPLHQVNGFTVLCNDGYEGSSQLQRRPPPLSQSIDMTAGTLAAQHQQHQQHQDGMLGGSGAAGPSNWKFVTDHDDDENLIFPKGEPQSPTLPDPFELLAPSAEQPFTMPGFNHAADLWQGGWPPTMSEPPGLGPGVRAMVDRLLPSWPLDMEGVYQCLTEYLHYLEVDPEVTLTDVEVHAEAVYKYLRWRREMEEWNERNNRGGY